MAAKTVEVRLIARVGQYASEINRVNSVNSRFGAELENTTSRASRAVTTLASSAALAGKITLLGIGAAMVVSAKAAIDFESSLTGVAKTTNLAGSALATFGKGLRNLSLEIPLNVNELARIAELGGQLGVPTDRLIEFTEVVAALGVTTNLSTEEAATSLARFVNIMGGSIGDVDKLGSVIVELGNNFATTEQEIASFGLRLAPIGQTVGLSEAAVLALGTTLSSLGVTAERGSTAIQRIFLDMEQAVQRGGSSLQDFASAAGVSAEEFAAAYEGDPLRALMMLVGGLKNVAASGEDVFAVLDSIGVRESRAIGVTLALSNGVDLLSDAYARANQQIEEGSALFEEAALRYGTTESQITLVANAFNDLRIELGQTFIESGFLVDVLGTLRELLGIIKDNKDALAAFARIAAVVSGLALANFFATIAVNASKSVAEFLTVIKTSQGLTRSLAAVRLSSFALSAAFGLLGRAAVGVGALWLVQAQRAAKLKAAIEELNQAVEAGASPAEGLTDILREGLSPAQIEVIQDAGFTIGQLADMMAKGEDAAGAFGRALRQDLTVTDLETLQKFLMGPSQEELGMSVALHDVEKALKAAQAASEGFRIDQIARFVDEFRELNPETRLTTEQIRALAAETQNLHGLDLAGWAQRVTDGMNFMDPAIRTAQDAWRDTANTMSGEVIPTFAEMVFALENGEGVYDKFVDDILRATDEFSDHIQSEFADIESSVKSGMPVWDEYGDAVDINTSKILESLGQFAEDMRAWADLQPELLELASENTLAVIDSWTPQQKAALARLREESAGEFIRFITDLNETYAEIDATTRDVWLTRLPAILGDSLPLFLQELRDIVARIEEENPGIDAGDAWTAGITEAVTNFTNDPALQNLLLGYLSDPALMEDMLKGGEGIGAQIARGILKGVASLADSLSSLINDLVKQGHIDPEDLPASLPPNLPPNLPKNIPEAAAFVPSVSMSDIRPSTAVRTSMAITNSSLSPTTNISIPIVNPESKDLNRAVDKAKLKIQAIVPMVERAWRLN